MFGSPARKCACHHNSTLKFYCKHSPKLSADFFQSTHHTPPPPSSSSSTNTHHHHHLRRGSGVLSGQRALTSEPGSPRLFERWRPSKKRHKSRDEAVSQVGSAAVDQATVVHIPGLDTETRARSKGGGGGGGENSGRKDCRQLITCGPGRDTHIHTLTHKHAFEHTHTHTHTLNTHANTHTQATPPLWAKATPTCDG